MLIWAVCCYGRYVVLDGGGVYIHTTDLVARPYMVGLWEAACCVLLPRLHIDPNIFFGKCCNLSTKVVENEQNFDLFPGAIFRGHHSRSQFCGINTADVLSVVQTSFPQRKLFFDAFELSQQKANQANQANQANKDRWSNGNLRHAKNFNCPKPRLALENFYNVRRSSRCQNDDHPRPILHPVYTCGGFSAGFRRHCLS